MKKLLSVIVMAAAAITATAQQCLDNELNCFCVIAGRKATVDGSVLMAHNEDDGGEQLPADDKFLNSYTPPPGIK